MDVDGVRFFPGNEGPHLPGGAAVPHRMQGQQQLGQTMGGLLVAALIHHHRVAVAFQLRTLGGKNGVLPAGQPVMAMDQQDFHAVFPPL